MAGQSLAMGEAFGKGFQYGKRKISSMSNEEFNALNFQQLSESIATDYKTMIPSLQESIRASDRLQDSVFKALADVIKDIPSQVLDFFQDVTNISATQNQSEITNVRLNRDQDIQADRDRIAKDLADAQQKLLEFTHGVLTAETLQDAKDRADKQTKQDKIDAQVSVQTSRTGEQQFTITNPSIATGTATGFIKSIPRTFTPAKKLRAPSSLKTQLKKRQEEVRVGAIQYQKLTSRSGVGANQRKRYWDLYKKGPQDRLSAFLNTYKKYDFS